MPDRTQRSLLLLLLQADSCHPIMFAATFAVAAAAAASRRREFDHFVVVDFEATCERGRRIYPQEIIEFPAVLVDAATGRLVSAFRAYVRPRHHPRLTDFCHELTGITQGDVDAGVGLAEALLRHDEWLEAAGAKGGGGGRFAVVTWGDADCRTMLEQECRFKGIDKPAYFDRWVDLRVHFEAAFGRGGRRVKLQEAVRAAGLEWAGRLHCGLDDACNTARLLVELLRRGVPISITGSLPAPPQLEPQLGSSSRSRSCCSIGRSSCSSRAAAAVCCYCGVASTGGVMAMPGSTVDATAVLLRLRQLDDGVGGDVPLLSDGRRSRLSYKLAILAWNSYTQKNM